MTQMADTEMPQKPMRSMLEDKTKLLIVEAYVFTYFVHTAL